jgi:ABC-type phosphate transport system auxiliary subunit
MSWSSVIAPLPCRAWAVIGPEGALITNPLSSRENAERLAGDNIRGTLRQAIKRGYRVAEIEIREVA